MKRFFLITSLFFLLSASSAHAGITQPPTTRGLVGYWSMEDCKLTKATDNSGRGNTGTLTNFALTGATSNWVAGKLGACALNFDGINDYLNTGLNLDAEPVSVALWIKPTSIDVAHCFWCTDNGQWDKGVEITAGTFQVHAGNVLVNTSVPAVVNVWQHVVATYTSTDIMLFVNGVRVWNRGSSPGVDSGSALELGRANYLAGAGSRFFVGSIDDVRVYNRALTGNEIARLYSGGASRTVAPTTRGLVGYWSMEDCKLTKATDNSGRGNTGTLTNFALTGVTSNWVAGKRGSCALNFDGNNDYVSAGTSTAIGSLTTNVTVSAWINSTNLSGIHRIVGASRTVTSNGFTFGTSGAGLLFTTFSVKDYTSTTITLSTNTWTHVVAVMSGFNVTYYVNGASAQTITGTANGNANTDDPLYIGASTPLGSSALQEVFSGSIDEVRIYNRALSAGEVAAIYNAGVVKINTSTAKLQTGTSLASGLVGHWTFDGKYLTSTKAKDSTTNLNHGTLTGANGLPRPIMGQLGQALKFDGVDDTISFSTTSATATNNWTMSAWINPSVLPTSGEVIAVSNGRDNGITGDGYSFGIGNASGGGGSKLEGLFSGLARFDSGYTFPSANRWYHVVMIRDAGTTYMYVDGVRTANTSAVTPATPSELHIGSQTGVRYFPGLIDDVRIYNRALPSSEVTQLYKLGR